MLKKISTLVFCLISFNVFALGVDDFMPIVQVENQESKQDLTKVNNPDEVKETEGFGGQTAIQAANAQDAINASISNLEASGGVQQIKFPSGFGWVASGVSSYGVFPNKTTTLTAQRNAYQKAYMQAKKNLAEALFGLSTEGKDELYSEMQATLNNTESLANTKESSSESITETVNGMLRGYVVYNVNDEQEKDTGVVTVTIVTTPKTMGKGKYVDPNSLSAESIRDGLQEVLNEVSSGLFPPVGGKTVTSASTGEMAFVGFGSAVIMQNDNPAVAKKMVINAQKIAQMRARSALCGIIIGDEISSESKFDESTAEVTAQFEQESKTDPLNNEPSEINKLKEQQNSYVSNMFTSEQISSMRKGVIPPGVGIKTFFNKENTLAQAIAVYIPSSTAAATSAGKAMNESQIIQSDTHQKNGTQGGVMPTRSASGQVTKDADL